MSKFTSKKTIFIASIILIAGIIASQAYAHMGGGYNMMPGSQMVSGGHMMDNGGAGMMMGSGQMINNYQMGNGYMMENFSAEDQQKILDQMNAFFTSTKVNRDQSYLKQIELNKEYTKSEKDQVKINGLQKELFELSVQFNEKRFEHMTTMQKLFSSKNSQFLMGMGGGYQGC